MMRHWTPHDAASTTPLYDGFAVSGWKLVVAPWLLLTFLCGTASRSAAPVAPGHDTAAAVALGTPPAPAQTFGDRTLLPDALLYGDALRATSHTRAPVRLRTAGGSAITRARAALAARDYLRYGAALRRARTNRPTTFSTPPPAFPA
jgi:hypothetical protein